MLIGAPGQEWLISTPRHVQLYDAFGWKAPLFAHVGLLVDKNRQKLSKRHGDIDIASYRNNDFLPAALLNYCALLGWSPEKSTQGPSEVMHLDEMIKKVRLPFALHTRRPLSSRLRSCGRHVDCSPC